MKQRVRAQVMAEEEIINGDGGNSPRGSAVTAARALKKNTGLS